MVSLRSDRRQHRPLRSGTPSVEKFVRNVRPRGLKFRKVLIRMWRAASRLARVNLKMAESDGSLVSSVSNPSRVEDKVEVSIDEDSASGSPGEFTH